MELHYLAGQHWLDAVDLITGVGEEPNGIRFRIDGRIYTAYENPDDGYRSSMREIFQEHNVDMHNVFESVRALATMEVAEESDDRESEILVFKDFYNGKTILRVGTCHSDSYYPSFVCEWTPEDMSVNEQEPVPPKRELSPEAKRQLRIIR